MAVQNLLIMNLLRIITPEEIADIATKHNGGKFLSLTELVNERVERNIHRDFSSTDSMDEIHEEHATFNDKKKENQAKILPFKLVKHVDEVSGEPLVGPELPPSFIARAITTSQIVQEEELVSEAKAVAEHKEDENMSSFIMVEKARLKKSQKTLKQKEIIDLYQKNSNIDVEQIKNTNQVAGNASEIGVLVNKKQY